MITNSALKRRMHPKLAQWFRKTFNEFTEAQLLCVPAVLDRKSILLTSPTGSGKTLAGFLGVFDFLLRQASKQSKAGSAKAKPFGLTAPVQCIYVSPLRALAYDIEK